MENVTGAVPLPPVGRREPCPPCNPGYHNSNDSTCLPCPPGTHSDGTNGKPELLPWQHLSVAFLSVAALRACGLDSAPLSYLFDCVPECAACPAGTEPVLGYEYKWWNVLPSNMKTSCFNVGNSKCDDMNGEN